MDTIVSEKILIHSKDDFDGVINEIVTLFENGLDAVTFFKEEAPASYPCILIYIPEYNDFGWYCNVAFCYPSDFDVSQFVFDPELCHRYVFETDLEKVDLKK